MPIFGLTGAALALFINSATQTLTFVIYASRTLFHVTILELVRRTVIRPMIAAALMAGLAYLVGRPLIHNRVTLVLVLLASPLVYLPAAFVLSAITVDDLGYGLALAERLPAWMPVRDRIVRLSRRPGANV